MYRRAVTALLFMALVALPGVSPVSGKDAAATDSVKLSGAGDQASDKFKLEAGISTWEISHEGRSNFQVSLLSSDGKSTSMTVNEIGRYKGTQVVRVARAGEYLLNVKADGKWSITIKQPRPAEAPGKPLEATGSGPSVTRFVTLPEGLSVFKATHKGSGVFRVKLFDGEGHLVEQPVAVIGTYDGSKAVKVEQAGIYIVNISASGEWSLKVQ
jgi:hypothetical protein